MWGRFVGFLTVGYFCLGRTFAYLGIPQAKLFIGELALGAFILAKPQAAIGVWAGSLLRPSPLTMLALAQYLFLICGVLQAVRGLFAGSGFDVIKYFVFNYYSFYLYFGLWAGRDDPNLLSRTLRAIAWFNGVYGLLYLVALKDIEIFLPGTENVRVFSQANASAAAVLGLICFEPRLGRVWHLLLLNIVVLLGNSVRAEWLGLGLAILLWALLTGRIGRVLGLGAAGLALLGLVELSGVQIAGRGEVSVSSIISRAVAPFDEKLASEFSPYAAEDGGTLKWRQAWWETIWAAANSDPQLELFGHGYGFDLFSLAPPSVRAGQEHENVRTPHNVFYYALGYTGWVGVLLFAFFQLSILGLQWTSYRRSGQPFGMLYWVAGIAISFFSNYFETPFQSIPFYLVMGMAMAPVLGPLPGRSLPDRPSQDQPLQDRQEAGPLPRRVAGAGGRR